MEISTGKFKQIDACAFPLQLKGHAWLKIQVPERSILKLKVLSVEKGQQSEYRLYGEEDYGVLELSHFTNSFGGGVGEPTTLAKSGDTQVYFTFSATTAGNFSFLQFQFWVEK